MESEVLTSLDDYLRVDDFKDILNCEGSAFWDNDIVLTLEIVKRKHPRLDLKGDNRAAAQDLFLELGNMAPDLEDDDEESVFEEFEMDGECIVEFSAGIGDVSLAQPSGDILAIRDTLNTYG
ncbi:hypothetical protein CFOL_v3_00948 [Cephalotus follicularis]|uniref:Uncharacterized protein n=1 Tax=Cephalotus follicularis TaxID=3775 RepID=A0A1Q3ANT4_CEPFO|nr:hypothetical protein CFOL_v3_00948 [Cephalotus follicularis]